MATVTTGSLILIDHSGPTPDPNLASVAEVAAAMLIDSVAISAATSKAVSTVSAAAPDSANLSTADSKAVSAGGLGSIANSKATSVSGNTSIADSKAISVSGNASIADSKAVSVGTATIIPTVGGIPGFLQPTATAVVRTANAKMADLISVSDFGAVGAAADESALIQKALDYINTLGYGRLFFPNKVYNIGTSGLVLPGAGSVEGVSQVVLNYSGAGNAIEGFTNKFGGTFKNFYVKCTNDAANGIRLGNGAQQPRLEKVTVQGSGNVTATGSGFLLDGGAPGAFSAYLTLSQVYSLFFKYGIRCTGTSPGTNTWTVIRGDTVNLVGRSNGVIPGSIGIWADVNTNAEASRITGVIESFAKPIQYDNADSCFGISFEGGCEGNTVDIPSFPAAFAGEYDDPHSSFYYRATANGTTNRWHFESLLNGLWTTASRYSRTHVVLDGTHAGTTIHGYAKGDVDGLNQEATLQVVQGGRGDTEPGRNKIVAFKNAFAWAAAVPTVGDHEVGDIIYINVYVAGQPREYINKNRGSNGALSSISGSITTGTSALTVNSTVGIAVGNFLAVAGVTFAGGGGKVTAINGMVVTLDVTANTTVTGAAVSYSVPNWVSQGNFA